MSGKVLFVDDDKRVLNGIARQFEDDVEFDTATSPEQALEMFDRDGPYAVVVSDLRMPGMDGFELLSRIGEKSSTTIRIMLTGNADESSASSMKDSTLFRCLAKPCDRDVLRETLQDALRQHHKLIAPPE